MIIVFPFLPELKQTYRNHFRLLSWCAKGLLVASGLLSLGLFSASSVWAVQSHGGAEGLVSHQIGHFLFISGMVYLLIRFHLMRIQGKGWREFKAFIWLLVLWNLMTFSGHWMDELVSREKFIKSNGSTLSFVADNFLDVLFYLTRLDHLLLVPAFIFLLLALRKWRASQ